VIESFTINDFTSKDWLDRPEYIDGDGIAISHLIAMHEKNNPYTSLQMFEALENQIYVFKYLIGLEWRIYVYSTNIHDDLSITTCTPLTMLYGTTYDGVRETYQAPCLSEPPEFLARVYDWVAQQIADNGWQKG